MLPEKQFICTKMFNLNKLGLLGVATVKPFLSGHSQKDLNEKW